MPLVLLGMGGIIKQLHTNWLLGCVSEAKGLDERK